MQINNIMFEDRLTIEVNGEIKTNDSQEFNLHELIETLKEQEDKGETSVFIRYSTDYDGDFLSLDFMFSKFRLENDEEYNIRMEKFKKAHEADEKRKLKYSAELEAKELKQYLKLKEKYDKK